jgi:alcohol dehydrogenase
MRAFEFNTVRRIVCEAGACARVAELCGGLDRRRVLLVTDPGVANAGLPQPAVASLEAAGSVVHVFADVVADPPVAVVEAAVEAARSFNATMILGLGGGSSMDVAKLVACLAFPESRLQLEDLYGLQSTPHPRLPLLQIPTTAGTGSEVTTVSIITTGESAKTGCGNAIFLPDLVVLDARLTLGLPPPVTAATGVDAMVHAIEAYTSRHRKNPLSDMLAREALRLLEPNIRPAVFDGRSEEVRQAMLLGATLAGQAFANAPVAAVHALAYPVGGIYHVPHGVSNALVMPEVLRFNAPVAEPLYAELAAVIQPGMGGSEHQRAQWFVEHLAALNRDLGIPTRLREVGVPADGLEQLADDAMLQQRLLVNNPRELTRDDAFRIYKAVY